MKTNFIRIIVLVLILPSITGCVFPYHYKVDGFAGEEKHDLNGVKLDFHISPSTFDNCSGSGGPPFTLILDFIGREIHKSLTIDSLVITLSDNNHIVMQLADKITKGFDNAYIDEDGSRLEGIIFSEKMDFKYGENSKLKLTANFTVELHSGEVYSESIENIFIPYYEDKWLLGFPLC